MYSMTGFGRGVAIEEGRTVTIEIKSVNSRYLDISCRIPQRLAMLEESIKAQVSSACSRGKVDVSLRYQNERQDQSNIVVNEMLAREYVASLRQLSTTLHLPLSVDARTVALYPGVLTAQEKEDDVAAIAVLCTQAVQQAVEELCAMRAAEGARIGEDLQKKLHIIAEQLEIVAAHAPVAEEQNRTRLLQKLQEFIEADEQLRQRVLTEAALIAERRNIDEELVRLRSHLAQLTEDLAAQGTVGRKLDFIVQECNREVNTIGSKCNDQQISAAVILMKSEIEKLREQVQNIE